MVSGEGDENLAVVVRHVDVTFDGREYAAAAEVVEPGFLDMAAGRDVLNVRQGHVGGFDVPEGGTVGCG